MGFQYPHYDAELMLGVFGSCLLLLVAGPVSRVVPDWASGPLLAAPLVSLLAVCVWVGYRARRGG